MAKKYDHQAQKSSEIVTIPTVDLSTGEWKLREVPFKEKQYGAHFWKCYLSKFLKMLDVIDSPQLKVLIYILKNTRPSDNLFIGTYDNICEETGVGYRTVSRVMKELQGREADDNAKKKICFVRKIQNGVWMVNPEILMKGDNNKKNYLASLFYSDNPAKQDNNDNSKNNDE